jgi:hypothetical protein
VLQSYPDLEAKGANLAVECILRGLKAGLEHYKKRGLRNFSVQLDNVNSNKGYTVLSAMCALVLSGVVQKVKLAFLLVGHTHEDIDACIGNVVAAIRKKNLATFEDFRRECMDAIKKDNGTVIDVEQLIGVGDYDKLFADANKAKIRGKYVY